MSFYIKSCSLSPFRPSSQRIYHTYSSPFIYPSSLLSSHSFPRPGSLRQTTSSPPSPAFQACSPAAASTCSSSTSRASSPLHAACSLRRRLARTRTPLRRAHSYILMQNSSYILMQRSSAFFPSSTGMQACVRALSRASRRERGDAS